MTLYKVRNTAVSIHCHITLWRMYWFSTVYVDTCTYLTDICMYVDTMSYLIDICMYIDTMSCLIDVIYVIDHLILLYMKMKWRMRVKY